MKYYSIHEFSKIISVTYQTLRNWDRSGKLKPHHTSFNGRANKTKKLVDELIKESEMIKND